MTILVEEHKDRQRLEAWQTYTATMLYALGKVTAQNWPFPTYESIAYPDRKTTGRDERTGAEILDALKQRLKAG